MKELEVEDQPETKYKDILTRLNEIYKEKIDKKIANEKSFFSRLRGWVSTILSVFILIMMLKGLLPDSFTDFVTGMFSAEKVY